MYTTDWSHTTKEMVDSLPRIWTRGLLYFLVLFAAIALPWAMLTKVEETGTARGRLEPQGKTFKLDAPVAGTVAEIHVKEGDKVAAGQILLSLKSELVRRELEQEQNLLEGQKNRLHQLTLLENQLILAIRTQEQQNQAQELEKEAQIEQARRQIQSLKKGLNLQKQEKQSQIEQAQQNLEHNQEAVQLLELRLANTQREVERYKEALAAGIVAEIQVVEREDIAQERQRLYQQALSDVQQARLRLAEQKTSYEQIMSQGEADIEQAELRLKEQSRSYESLLHAGNLALLRSEEQLQNVSTQITTLKAEIAQSQSQIEALQFQLEQRVLVAPIDGTVFELAPGGAGEVVQTGNLIGEIAPEGTSLVLRGEMGTGESGSLKPGMAVKMKFDAYPFQDYGVIEGELRKISPTSKVTETQQGKVAAYDLEIALHRSCIPTPNECVPLRPGDTATAEVILRRRRVIDFILDPFKKLQKGGLEL